VSDVLRLDDYQNLQDILDKVSYINKVYYTPAACNILYLEESNKEISVIYMIAMRDAHSHLEKALEYFNRENGVLNDDSRTKITRQLERYLGHLEELLYDTYLRIINEKLNVLLKRLRKKEQDIVKSQLSSQIQSVRTMGDDISIEQKKENFEKIIEYIENY